MKLSVLGRRWQLGTTNWRQAAALSQQTGLSPLVCKLLAGQGVATPAAATAFLNPRLAALPDPALMPDIAAATTRLAQAVHNGEALCIFGDYDVDGTCATAMATRYFRQLGLKPTHYVPDRLTEGYGPNPQAMRSIKAGGAGLVLTVDTGTMAHAALEEAQNLGLEVIVTDHHPLHGARPPCLALVNPHAGAAPEELSMLSGSGVLFYLLMALNRHLRQEGFFTATKPEPDLTRLLDLAALATVCDVMPLAGANRILVGKGLSQLSRWQNGGLAALAAVAGVKNTPDTYALGFQLGPRLNAAGRIESATTALELLLTDDDAAAERAAHTLNELNRRRQEMEKEALHGAMAQAEEQMADDPAVLFVRGPWHAGVVGLIASRVKEKFYRPTFALAEMDNLLKGSARSIDGVDIGAAVAAAGAHTQSGGGHAMAAGVTLEQARFAAFTEAVTAHVQNQLAALPEDTLVPLTTLAAQLPAEGVAETLLADLAQLEPFGSGNPEPVLAVTGAHIAYAKPVGAAQEHIRIRLATGAEGVAFGAGKTSLGPALTTSAKKPLTLAVKLRSNTWNGRTTLDLHVQDAHTDFSGNPAA